MNKFYNDIRKVDNDKLKEQVSIRYRGQLIDIEPTTVVLDSSDFNEVQQCAASAAQVFQPKVREHQYPVPKPRTSMDTS